MKTDKQEPEILTADLRKTLKALFQKEIEALPGTLSKLDAEKRLGILLKLMPYVLPKVDNVSHRQGESDEFKIQRMEW